MRLPKTNILKPTIKLKAFTLMEILIAASIFAAVMIITTGVLAQSSSSRGKIKAQRDVAEETKKLADLITRNVRESNYPGKVELCTASPCSAPLAVKDFKNGLAIIYIGNFVSNTNNPIGGFRNNITPHNGYVVDDSYTNQGQVLITTDKNKYKVIYAKVAGGVYYKDFNRIDSSGNVLTLSNANIGTVTGYTTRFPENAISNISNIVTNMYFSGFAPDSTSTTKLQPYVQFFIGSKTNNYDTLPPNSRAESVIRSSVTARSFSN